MKYLLILLVIPFLSATECGKKKKDALPTEVQTEIVDTKIDSIPACVQKLIDDGNKETPSTAPIQVDEYLYKDKKVYLAIAQCCDFFNLLYDENCKEICAPTGGFTGKGDGKCPDFEKEAKLIKTIWKEKSE